MARNVVASLQDLRILIVADDPLARGGLATLLLDQPGCEIAGQAASQADLRGDIDGYPPFIWK